MQSRFHIGGPAEAVAKTFDNFVAAGIPFIEKYKTSEDSIHVNGSRRMAELAIRIPTDHAFTTIWLRDRDIALAKLSSLVPLYLDGPKWWLTK